VRARTPPLRLPLAVAPALALPLARTPTPNPKVGELDDLFARELRLKTVRVSRRLTLVAPTLIQTLVARAAAQDALALGVGVGAGVGVGVGLGLGLPQP